MADATHPIVPGEGELPPLSICGVSRDADSSRSLCLFFDREATDNEMRGIHDMFIALRGTKFDAERRAALAAHSASRSVAEEREPMLASSKPIDDLAGAAEFAHKILEGIVARRRQEGDLLTPIRTISDATPGARIAAERLGRAIAAFDTNYRHAAPKAEAISGNSASRAVPEGWQHIETAPQGSGLDGPGNVTDPAYVKPPEILLWTKEGVRVGFYDWYYHEGYGAGAEPGVSAWRTLPDYDQAYSPTHWMLLPSAPGAAHPPAAPQAATDEPMYLVMAGGDGFQSSIVPASKLDEAYLLTQWCDLNSVDATERAEALENFHDDDNWQHTDVTGNGERLEFELSFEDGWVRVIRLFDTTALATPPQPASPDVASGGDVKLPAGWVPCLITYEGEEPEEVAFGPKLMMDRLTKWLTVYFEHVYAERYPATQAKAAQPAQAVADDNELAARAWDRKFLSVRLRRVLRLVGLRGYAEMADEDLAAIAGTALGSVALTLERSGFEALDADLCSLDKVAEAYGHLWHVNNEPMAPIPLRSPEKAAYEARKILRDMLTHEQRGEAIHKVGRALGVYSDDGASHG